MIISLNDCLFDVEFMRCFNYTSIAITDCIAEFDVSLEIAWWSELPIAIAEIFERAFGRLEIFDRQLVTIFTAPNYCGEFDNAGAIMVVDEDLMCSFRILKPADKANFSFGANGAPKDRSATPPKGAGRPDSPGSAAKRR